MRVTLRVLLAGSRWEIVDLSLCDSTCNQFCQVGQEAQQHLALRTDSRQTDYFIEQRYSTDSSAVLVAFVQWILKYIDL